MKMSEELQRRRKRSSSKDSAVRSQILRSSKGRPLS
jgi:hypothetical protein